MVERRGSRGVLFFFISRIWVEIERRRGRVISFRVLAFGLFEGFLLFFELFY